MEMGDQSKVDLVVAAAQSNVEPKAECWQLLTVDEATYHSWKSLAQSQSLLSDSLVANFLLQHYEKTSCLTLTECFKCHGPLSQYCLKCNVYMGQHLDCPSSSGSSVKDVSTGENLPANSPSSETPGKCDEWYFTDCPKDQSLKHLQVGENLKHAAASSRTLQGLADSDCDKALEASNPVADTAQTGLDTTMDTRHCADNGDTNLIQDSSKATCLSSTRNNRQDPVLSKTQDNNSKSMRLGIQETSKISGPTTADATIGLGEISKPSSRTVAARSQGRNKIILNERNENTIAPVSSQTQAAELPQHGHASLQASPQRRKRKAELFTRCGLFAKVRAVQDTKVVQQEEDETESVVKRENGNTASEETKKGISDSKDNTKPRRKRRQTKQDACRRKHPCKDCGEEFHFKKELDAHLKKLHRDKPYTCTHCPASFMRSYHLTSHLRKHALTKPHICSHCSKAFAWPNDLKVHEATHSTLRPHVCDVCGFACKTKSNLKLHKRRHDSSTSKAYVCPRCGEGFRWRSNFREHKKLHDDENAFACPHCPMKYTQSGSLRRHLQRNHLKNRPRPYVCDICGVARYEKTQFEKHMMIHTGVKPHQCDVCGAAFIQINALKDHMKIHTETLGKANWCSLCGAAFKRFASVKIHMKKVHKRQVEDLETVEINLSEEDLGTPLLVQNVS